MADIEVYFYALREEMAPWLQAIASEFGLHATIVRFPPYQATYVPAGKLAQLVLDPSVCHLSLTQHLPHLPANGAMQFLDQNPGALSIELGKLTSKGLSESWMTARTSDDTTLALWKRIARRLKAWTKTGAVVYNLESGAHGPVPYRRFSPGARDLEARGIMLYEGNGGNVYRFPKQVK